MEDTPITTKDQCPNYSNGGLDTSWLTYVSTDEDFSPTESSLCFNICGENHYIENLGSRQECVQCPPKPAEWNPDDREGETPEIAELRRKGILNMCEYATTIGPDYTEPRLINEKAEWFLEQQSANIQGNFLEQINWSSDEAKILWSKYNDYGSSNPRMTNPQLLAMFGSRVPGSFNEDNTPIYTLPIRYGDPSDKDAQIAALRVEINTGRGSIIDCNAPILSVSNSAMCQEKGGDWDGSVCTAPAAAWATCSPDSKFGVNDIIYEEAYDYWLSEFDRLDPSTDSERDISGVSSFSDLMSGLSIDSNFESCVNAVLNTGDNDKKIQERINEYTKITDFTNEDINYLQGKLRQIILAKETDVNECMNMLNIGESVCTSGVSDKMLQIGHLVISIIGANKVNMRDLDIDDRYKLNSMVDRLGHLLPQAIKNIIHISKQYETRVCNAPSNTTLLLERLYIDLYDKQTNVTLDLSSYVDFTSLIDTPNTIDGNVRFFKTIVAVAVIGYLLMHLTDFVSKFISRGSK
jgi:hypothetical protein